MKRVCAFVCVALLPFGLLCCWLYACVCSCVPVPVCLHVWCCDVWFVCVSSEGKMVVLSLAIGLAEQDDFANLPDLQEAPASKENETTPEKR